HDQQGGADCRAWIQPQSHLVPSKNSILSKSLRQCVLKRQRVLDPFRFVLIAVGGWMNQQQQFAIDYRREENRVLKEQLGRRRLRLNDDQRRRLAAKAKRLGRRVLEEPAGSATP